MSLQVRKRGVVTLPAELREKYDIQEGDTFRLVDLHGVFVLTWMVSLVPELAQEIERLRLGAGLTTEELLDGLRMAGDPKRGQSRAETSRRNGAVPRRVRPALAQRLDVHGSDRRVDSQHTVEEFDRDELDHGGERAFEGTV